MKGISEPLLPSISFLPGAFARVEIPAIPSKITPSQGPFVNSPILRLFLSEWFLQGDARQALCCLHTDFKAGEDLYKFGIMPRGPSEAVR